MAEALSRLHNPRRPMEGKQPAHVDTGAGDSHHDAAEMMHDAEPDSKHMIVSHDGMSMKSHGIDENGMHDGPHDHENMEALKSHMNKFFNEEEDEGKQDGNGEEPEEEQSIY